MSVKDNIKVFIKSNGMTVSDFEKSISVANGYVNSISKSIGIDKTALILEKYPNLNLEWLITGKGEMLKQVPNDEPLEKPTKYKKGIPLIPVDAMAGYANGDVQVMEYELENYYNIPDFEEKGVKFLIRASGSSMYPKYSNGDILACRPVTDLSFFQWGKVYVLDTDQGPIVKRLYPFPDDNECLECRSDNKENYPPFHINKASIRKISIVVGVIRME